MKASDYERNSRIALAGYEAFHELTACVLSAALGRGENARILVVGAGTAKEIVMAAQVAPTWRFVGVDPSAAMLDVARENVASAGISDRVVLQLGTVDDVHADALFDAATLIGVLHHVAGDEAKVSTLRGIADWLKPDAPLVLAGHCGIYAEQPLLLAALAERWRVNGATPEQVAARREKLSEATDAPASEDALFDLLAATGFSSPVRYFTSLFWGAWVGRKEYPSPDVPRPSR
jgi:tRNA (cmo5U34)-methyltransferase